MKGLKIILRALLPRHAGFNHSKFPLQLSPFPLAAQVYLFESGKLTFNNLRA
ncbi:MAG TPA: hypothetical protein VNO70_18080 [Blastocatellia bacterium]|nr:hypothetical protein [Blastocatellia bacterium]